MVIVFSFVTIKVKSRKNKKGMLNFSNFSEDKFIMSERNSNIVNQKSKALLNNRVFLSDSKNSNDSEGNKKMRIYEVYNPDNNPNFYMHNKLNWYKNFD